MGVDSWVSLNRPKRVLHETVQRLAIEIEGFLLDARMGLNTPLFRDQRVAILASVALHIKLKSLLGDILPAGAGFPPQQAFAGRTPYCVVAEHGENIEHCSLAGAVPSDNQLLRGRPELEVHEAPIVGYVQPLEHISLLTAPEHTSPCTRFVRAAATSRQNTACKRLGVPWRR